MPSLTRTDYPVTSTGALVFTAADVAKVYATAICDAEGIFVSVFRAGVLVSNANLQHGAGMMNASLQVGDTIYAVSFGGDAILKILIEDAS